jgi:thiamine transport system substrate-binding protein
MSKFLQVVLAVSALLAVAAVACGGDEAEPTTVPPAPTSAAANPTATTPAPSPTPSEPRELIVMTHDSFDVSEEVIREFEQANNAKVVIQKGGDAGEVLVRAILEKGNPSADLLYGVDNTYLSRALAEGIFVVYESPLLANLPSHLLFDQTFHVTPINFAYVNLNYDKAYLAENGLEPPTTLEELTGPKWKGRLVVQHPGTSSPGLAFLIATVSYFGEDDDYDYLDFWADLRANNVLVKDGWSGAYYTDFSHYGGDRPLVVSYATSPAAEVYFSEGKYAEPPTGNVLVDKATFLQVEGVGILVGSKNVDLARRFIDFMLDTRFQEDIPSKMFVYPANSQAKTPDFFRFAEVPTTPADIGPAMIDAKRDEWIDAWTRTVLR